MKKNKGEDRSARICCPALGAKTKTGKSETRRQRQQRVEKDVQVAHPEYVPEVQIVTEKFHVNVLERLRPEFAEKSSILDHNNMPALSSFFMSKKLLL